MKVIMKMVIHILEIEFSYDEIFDEKLDSLDEKHKEEIDYKKIGFVLVMTKK